MSKSKISEVKDNLTARWALVGQTWWVPGDKEPLTCTYVAWRTHDAYIHLRNQQTCRSNAQIRVYSGPDGWAAYAEPWVDHRTGRATRCSAEAMATAAEVAAEIQRDLRSKFPSKVRKAPVVAEVCTELDFSFGEE